MKSQHNITESSDDWLLKDVTFRNIYCPQYFGCLTAAATIDAKKLNCAGCQHQYDKVEPESFEDFDFQEIESCCRLIHAVFFRE